MTIATAVVVDASVLIALSLLLCRALRHRPAALRHLVLASSLAGAAVAPVLEIVLPRWELPLLAAPAPATSTGLAFSTSPAAPPVPAAIVSPAPLAITWSDALCTLWLLGFVVVFARLSAGVASLAQTARHGERMESGAWREELDALLARDGWNRPVTLVRSHERTPLLTWGLWRPWIIVPSAATVLPCSFSSARHRLPSPRTPSFAPPIASSRSWTGTGRP